MRRHAPGRILLPSFEILNDDLRDYRFYADDMVHPSSAAVEYIWDKFRQSAIDDEAQALMPRVEKIVTAAAHTDRWCRTAQHTQSSAGVRSQR